MRYFLLIAIELFGLCTLGFTEETDSNIKEKFITGIYPQFEVAEYLFSDLNNDQYDEFIAVGKQGQIKTWSYKSEKNDFEEIGNSWILSYPNQSILSLSSFSLNNKKLYLMSLTPDGLIAYAANQDGSIEPNGILINNRMKFLLKIDQPVFAKFMQDINQDGLTDIIVPVINYCEIWINTGLAGNESSPEQNQTPAFSKIGKFPIEMSHTRETDLQNNTGTLSENFSIPNLSLKDVNGDKYPDLIVSHKPLYDYYLLGKDSRIPEKPTVSLDLNLFQDTTPKAEGIQFGETLSINSEPQLLESDLNNDGIPDYIIFHRRKMWIFQGTSQGPQFLNPCSIIKVAEDITILLPVPLDEDEFPDLLMLKVQIPTVSKFLMGLFSDWDIKTESIGYKSINGSSFELCSTWNGEIFLRLPSILSMISNPEIFNEFNIEQKYGPAVYGDFNEDGFLDVGMANVNNGNFEIWLGREQDPIEPNANHDDKSMAASKIRQLLFTETDNVWDLDRIITTINSLINDQVAAVTGGRSPDYYISLFKEKKDLKVLSIDFNHDKKNELLFIYSNPEAINIKRFDLYTLTDK
jgi:hypothetical protein